MVIPTPTDPSCADAIVALAVIHADPRGFSRRAGLLIAGALSAVPPTSATASPGNDESTNLIQSHDSENTAHCAALIEST
jgi:hypothetical protein